MINEMFYEMPYYESLDHIVETLSGRGHVAVIATHGLHCLGLLAGGTEKVTAVDRSKLQLSLNHLYRSAVGNLSRRNFMNLFVEPKSRKQRRDRVLGSWSALSKDIPEELHPFVREILGDTEEYGTYTFIRYSEAKQKDGGFFSFADSEKGYKNAQRAVSEGRYAIAGANIFDFLRSARAASFDGIYLSNAVEWCQEEAQKPVAAAVLPKTARVCGNALKKGGVVYVAEIKLHNDNAFQTMNSGVDMSKITSVKDSGAWRKRFAIDYQEASTKTSKYYAAVAKKK